MLKYACQVSIICCLLISSVQSDPYAQASKRKFNKTLIMAAKLGESSAQLSLGIIYNDGKEGVKQDYHQAVNWYRKAAEHGDPLGQFNLGVMYENGYGVKQNKSSAKK